MVSLLACRTWWDTMSNHGYDRECAVSKRQEVHFTNIYDERSHRAQGGIKGWVESLFEVVVCVS